ncbi:LacI family transcriptional regulator [Rhizobium laguerreae]|nr:LacI family transcriptional regulator [Rhizobium laguerreae]
MTHPKAKGQVARARASITIVDVARLAGVNPSTVSRALSGSPAVTPQTRARIAEIARESGYVANHNARMLRSRKSNQILVIVPNIAAFSHPDVILGIEEALEEHNIGVIVGSTKGSEEREVALARHLIPGTADGLILLNGRLPSELGELPQYTRRIVAISRPIANPAIAFVGIDNEKALLRRRSICFLSAAAASCIWRDRSRAQFSPPVRKAIETRCDKRVSMNTARCNISACSIFPPGERPCGASSADDICRMPSYAPATNLPSAQSR